MLPEGPANQEPAPDEKRHCPQHQEQGGVRAAGIRQLLGLGAVGNSPPPPHFGRFSPDPGSSSTDGASFGSLGLSGFGGGPLRPP